MTEQDKKYCSFCNKSEDQVEVVIENSKGPNPDARICDRCVDHCREIIKQRFVQRLMERWNILK